MTQVNFNWSPFKEDIGIFGKKGTGKTTRCRKVLDLVPNLPRFIWSPQRPTENYGGYGMPVDSLANIKHGALLWTGSYDKDTFVKVVTRINQMRNIIFVCDDVHQYVTKQKMPYELETLVLSGRNRGISSIFLSPAPNLVHNAILGSCSHIFGYSFTLQSQIEWMKNNFFGNEAWLLIPKDKRNKYYLSDSDPDVIAPYSFIYRKDSDSRTQIILTGTEKPIELETLNNETEPVIDSADTTEVKESNESNTNIES